MRLFKGVPDAARVIKDVAGIIRATTVSVAVINDLTTFSKTFVY